MLTKRCLRFFKFYLDLELLSKIKKSRFPHARFFAFFLIIQDLNKKKIAKHLFVDIVNNTLREKLQTQFK